MYGAITALHYSAYRPPLHSIILERALRENKKRQIGLDIGCGTGRSAQELAYFCNRVVGLEPSKSMLSKTKKHEKVDYVNSPGENIPIAARSADVVTLAGSLNYIERNSLISELVRICRADAEIVVYDFEIDLTYFEEVLGINLENSSLEYDHSTNLSGHSNFDEITVVEDEFSTYASPLEIAHLLLSNQERHTALCRKYKISNPVSLLENKISSMSKIISFKSNIFYSVYSVSNKENHDTRT
jgi:ubiquinone/menaquinone biosynthesis C-methylase UbiE